MHNLAIDMTPVSGIKLTSSSWEFVSFWCQLATFLAKNLVTLKMISKEI